MQRDTFSVFKWQLNYIICLFMFVRFFFSLHLFVTRLHISLRSLWIEWKWWWYHFVLIITWSRYEPLFLLCFILSRASSKVSLKWLNHLFVYICLFKCSIGLNHQVLMVYNKRGKEEGSHILSFTTSQDLFRFYRQHKGINATVLYVGNNLNKF